MARKEISVVTPSTETVAIGAGRIVGASTATIPFTNADSPLTIYGGPGATNPMQLSVTPPYDSWWPIFGEVIAKTVDAAWFRFNVKFRLNVADAFGQQSLTDGIMHHSAATDWNHARPHGMFALAANTAYTVTMVFDGSTGGSWQYYQGGGSLGHTYIWSPGIIRR